jgi:hypothetical protein
LLSFNLAIVAAVLAAQGIFGGRELRRTVLLGKLGLDGRLHPVRGILPATLAAQQPGFTRVIVPLRQAGGPTSRRDPALWCCLDHTVGGLPAWLVRDKSGFDAVVGSDEDAAVLLPVCTGELAGALEKLVGTEELERQIGAWLDERRDRSG